MVMVMMMVMVNNEHERRWDMTYEEWCEHYDYDPTSEQAAEEWGQYLIEREFAESLFADELEPR